MIRAFGAIAIVFFAASFAHGEDAELERLKKIAQDYDTIIVGKIKSVTLRQLDGPSPNRWSLLVDVSEVLQGKELPRNEVSVYVHSPVQEFGVSGLRSSEMVGLPVCFALKRSGDDFIKQTAPFSGHQFNDSDILLLKQAIREKPPAPPKPPKPAPADVPAPATPAAPATPKPPKPASNTPAAPAKTPKTPAK